MLHNAARRRAAILTLNLMLALSIGSGWLVPRWVAAQKPAEVFSHGTGTVDIFVFTDYFCPPCQAVEPYLEGALTDLLALGAAVTFVDKPITPRTPLYSRQFLYAANATDRFEELLRIRRTLFDIARNNPVDSESELVRLMKESDIRLKLFDVRPVFTKWAEIIGRFGVRSTPTCIVTRPGQETLVFEGSREIPQGLDRLLKEMAGGD